MIPEYDDIKTHMDVVYDDYPEKERILELHQQLEIRQAYFDMYAVEGYGSGKRIMRQLAKRFNKSVERISAIVYQK